MSIKVLMFGWEFPPLYSGGLGIACYGLTKALSHQDVEVTFVMPKGPADISSEHVKLIVASNLAGYKLNIKKIPSILTPYMTSEQYSHEYEKIHKNPATSVSISSLYGKDLYAEVYRLSQSARTIALSEEFDIIHCHDWMTFPAGIEAKNASGKPLIIHVHATEYDRTGNGAVNPYVYEIEREGMIAADRIIAVSNFTKQRIMQYGISEDKIEVVHNGMDTSCDKQFFIKDEEKIVLFLGRLTLQKGPDYFIEAAKKVLDFDPDVKFIIAGTGDMESRLILQAAQLGIGNKVLFAGMLAGADIDRAYQMADLYVMPSVSEPFGLTPLEALRNNTPVIISRQSGVSEILKNSLKVDFWDIDELANKIISVLNYKALHHELRHHGHLEVQAFSWDTPAAKCIAIYQKVLAQRSGSMQERNVQSQMIIGA